MHRLVVEVFQTVMVVFSEAQAVNCMGEFMNDYSNVLEIWPETPGDRAVGYTLGELS